MTVKTERRIESRKRPVSLVYVELPPSNGGMMRDLSERGFSIRAMMPLQPSEKVPFAFSFDNGVRIDGEAIVIRVSDGGRVAALEFAGLPAHSRDQIRRWLEKFDAPLTRETPPAKPSAAQSSSLDDLRQEARTVSPRPPVAPAAREVASPPPPVPPQTSAPPPPPSPQQLQQATTPLPPVELQQTPEAAPPPTPPPPPAPEPEMEVSQHHGPSLPAMQIRQAEPLPPSPTPPVVAELLFQPPWEQPHTASPPPPPATPEPEHEAAEHDRPFLPAMQIRSAEPVPHPPPPPVAPEPVFQPLREQAPTPIPVSPPVAVEPVIESRREPPPPPPPPVLPLAPEPAIQPVHQVPSPAPPPPQLEPPLQPPPLLKLSSVRASSPAEVGAEPIIAAAHHTSAHAAPTPPPQVPIQDLLIPPPSLVQKQTTAMRPLPPPLEPLSSLEAEADEGSSGRLEGFTPTRAVGLMTVIALLVGSVVYHREVGRALIWLGQQIAGEESSESLQAPQAARPAAPPPAPAGSGSSPTAESTRSPNSVAPAAATTESNSAAPPPVTENLPASQPKDTNPDSRVPSAETNSPQASSASAAHPSDTGQQEYKQAAQILHAPGRKAEMAEAIRLLWAAVKKGNVPAEITLAELYHQGRGVPKSCDQTRILLSAAAQKGSKDAQARLQEFRRKGCKD